MPLGQGPKFKRSFSMTKKQTKTDLISSLTESLKNPNLSARDRAPLSRLLAKLSDINIDAPITELRKRKKEAAAKAKQQSQWEPHFTDPDWLEHWLPVYEMGYGSAPTDTWIVDDYRDWLVRQGQADKADKLMEETAELRQLSQLTLEQYQYALEQIRGRGGVEVEEFMRLGRSAPTVKSASS
jgi:hypothetical protein